MSIKKFFNFLIYGKISLGHKEQEIFEEKATDENSIRYHYTTKSKTRRVNADSSEAICQIGRDMGYMASMFPFSPPGENNLKTAVVEISDRVEAQQHRLTQVKRKRDVMLFEDESLFKKYKCYASVLTVDPITESETSFAEPPITNNRPVRFIVRSAPVDIPKKHCIQL